MIIEFFNWIKNLIPNFMDWLGGITVNSIGTFIGNTLVLGGGVGEFVGMLMIITGLFLIRFKMIKMLRKGFLIYLVSLLCELVGITLL